MNIAWPVFTPWSATVGGAFIGLSAGMLLLLNGRIAGISGIVGGLLRPSRGDVGWRLAFVAGLLAAPGIAMLFHRLPALRIDAGTPMLVAAGLLVGIGTRYASGCTSGHGVCGLSRQSPRSVIATLAFMGFGFATVYVMRNLLRF